MNDILDTFLEIELREEESFLKIKETLSRIGVASKKDKTLYQSCHILHKKGKYYIVHFKEMFALDGKPFTFTEEDKARRNRIAALLNEWGLLSIVNAPDSFKDNLAPMSQVKIINYTEKTDWKLESKYNIGRKKI